MLYYYLGIPGSGKSYAGVELIYNNFSDDKEVKKDKKYDWNNCYTNINEFQFDKINNVYEFKFDEFYKQLEKLYEIYNDKNKTDKDLIEKATEFKIYKTLFVIDECHRYFDVQDKVLVWWLTYHRHLYHDLILITQSLGLIHSKYKPLAEAFFRAKPSSLTLNKKYFNYTYFTDSRLTQAGKVNVVKVKKNKKVFALYHSGDSVKSKNVIKRFLIIAFSFFLLLLIIGYFYINDKNKDIDKFRQNHIDTNIKDTSNSLSVSYSKSINEKDLSDFSDKKFIKLSCSFSVCSNEHISLPPKLLKKFIDMEFLHKFYDEKVSNYLTIVYLSSSIDFYNFIITEQGGINNEDGNMDINLFGESKSK